MGYIEFHISEKNFERIKFISIILVLALICFFALKRQTTCPEVVCEEPTAEEDTQPIQEEEQIEEENKEPEAEERPLIYYVDIKNMNFAPKDLTIRKNSVIVFRNKEPAMVHKLYEVKGLFLGPRIEPYDKFNYTFNTTGNFTILSIMGKEQGMKMDVKVIE